MFLSDESQSISCLRLDDRLFRHGSSAILFQGCNPFLLNSYLRLEVLNQGCKRLLKSSLLDSCLRLVVINFIGDGNF